MLLQILLKSTIFELVDSLINGLWLLYYPLTPPPTPQKRKKLFSSKKIDLFKIITKYFVHETAVELFLKPMKYHGKPLSGIIMQVFKNRSEVS